MYYITYCYWYCMAVIILVFNQYTSTACRIYIWPLYLMEDIFSLLVGFLIVGNLGFLSSPTCRVPLFVGTLGLIFTYLWGPRVPTCGGALGSLLVGTLGSFFPNLWGTLSCHFPLLGKERGVSTCYHFPALCPLSLCLSSAVASPHHNGVSNH